MKKPFDKTSEPFGSDLSDDSMNLLSSGHFQPGEIIEDVTMFDVTQLLEEVLFETCIYEQKRVMYELDYFTLSVRPLEAIDHWGGEKTTSSLYFESRVRNLQFFDFKLLAELNLRYKLLKVFVNNENQLCFCFPLVLEGVTSEHLVSAIRSYITDLNDAKEVIKKLVSSNNHDIKVKH